MSRTKDFITIETATEAAKDILSAFAMGGDSALIEVINRLPTPDRFQYVHLSAVYETLLAFNQARQPITATDVAGSLGMDALDLYYVDAPPPHADNPKNMMKALRANISRLKRYNKQRRFHELNVEAARLLVEEGVDAALSHTLERAPEIASDQEDSRDNSAAAAILAARERRKRSRDFFFLSGLPYLDGMLEGISQNDKLTFSGAQKGRKSTEVRNLNLALVYEKIAAITFLFEATREDYIDDLTAMIANLFLIQTGREPQITRRRIQAWHTYSTIPADWYEAVAAADAIMDEIAKDERLLRIYDLDDGIEDDRMLINKARLDNLRYGSRMAIIDDGTSINFFRRGETYTDRENARRAGMFMQSFYVNTGMALVMLWQLKDAEQKMDGAGTGLMGGIGVGAKMDALIQVRYDKDQPDFMVVKVREGRGVAGGGATETRIRIDKRSGIQLGYQLRSGGTDDAPTWDKEIPLAIVPSAVLLKDWKKPAGIPQPLPMGGGDGDDLDEMLDTRK